MRKRVKKLEQRAGGQLYRSLRKLGFDRARARELVMPDGSLATHEATDAELEQIAGEGIEVAGKLVPWERVTDEQLARLAADEPPAKVLQGLL